MQGIPRFSGAVLMALLGATSAAHAAGAPGQASTTASFSSATGAMDVNYAGYLSKHDVIYNQPITTPVWGATVGNGRMGAMVWSANGLTMQVGAVDASEETAFSGGTLNLYTSPGMDTGYTTFQQRLSLYNGTLTTTYDSNRTVTIFGSPNSEVMGINVSDARTNVTSVTLDLSIWDVSQESGAGSSGGGASVPSLATWQTVSTYADSTGIGLSRGQTDSNNFGYTLAATVSGAAFTTQTVNSNDVRLVITPTSNYTIWFTCATRLNAPNHNSVTQAHTLLASAVSTGYTSTLTSFQNWWHAFWAKYFVQYSNSSGDADYMENMCYLYSYIIAAGAYATYPFHFINGDFSAVQDQHLQKWACCYWYWNERNIYNNWLASNHPEILDVLMNMYSRDITALESDARNRGFSGIWTPEVMGFDAKDDSSGSGYNNDNFTSGAEVAENMYLRYKYTGDNTYLSTVAYPFMREIAMFYANELSVNSSGQYYMAKSNAHETYWDIQDSVTDLMAIRSLFPEVIAAANSLGLDASLVPQWQNILTKLVPYPANATEYLPTDTANAQTHNSENVASEMLWPYDVTGIGYADYALSDSTYVNRPFPYSNIWATDVVEADRLGLGDASYQGMRQMLQSYQSYPNGRTNNTNGEFEYIGMHLSDLNESLLQSYNDVIRVFPAQPSDTSFVSSFTLAAKDGFLVSAERDSGGIKYVGIKSVLGNTATVDNPWGTQSIDVRAMSSNQVVTTSASAQFSFPTAANTVYIVERTAQPFSNYSHIQLTGTQNNNAKLLAGGAAQLGLFAGIAPNSGIYPVKNAVLSNCTLNADAGAEGGDQVNNVSTGSSITFNNVLSGTSIIIGYATEENPGKLGLYINGTLNQVVTFPDTNSWGVTYSTVTLNVNVPSGASIKLQEDSGESPANFDYIEVPQAAPPAASPSPSPSEGPYGSSAAGIPGTVQAENYDVGGQGVAYNISSVNETAEGYRPDEVDLEATTDTGAGYDLGWTSSGQWFRYSVNVATAGIYLVNFRVAAPSAVTDAFHLANSSGTNLTGAVAVPATAGEQNWATVTANVALPAGPQVLTLDEDNGGWNINYASFVVSGTCQTVASTWTSAPFAAQMGSFTATLTAIPSANDINAVIGLSDGAQSSYSALPMIVRFNPAGDIDAYNNGSYSAASTIPYSGGTTYSFEFDVNTATQTYSVYVTPAGGTQTLVGQNYSFSFGVNILNSLTAYSAVGSTQICGSANVFSRSARTSHSTWITTRSGP